MEALIAPFCRIQIHQQSRYVLGAAIKFSAVEHSRYHQSEPFSAAQSRSCCGFADRWRDIPSPSASSCMRLACLEILLRFTATSSMTLLCCYKTPLLNLHLL